MKVIICAQKKFGLDILQLCVVFRFDIAGVVCPADDNEVRPYALKNNFRVIDSGHLCLNDIPTNCDLGITVHSFEIIKPDLLTSTRLGWIGFHPSLLPRHRGKSAIEWALRMKDIVTGGTIYWLSEKIDEGDIFLQQWCWLDHDKTAKRVWDEDIRPLGLLLFEQAFGKFNRNHIYGMDQALLQKFATIEPAIDKRFQLT